MRNEKLRNIAIIAHVDHGKTTLIDQILKQGHLFRDNETVQECLLDSNDLERERGITILSKNVSIRYQGVKINIIDTPGHSDFAGQVERVLKLADGVLLLVDAAEGPMPQTRFVLDKALALNLKPLVILNKVDRPDARPAEVHDKVFDLFVELEASNEQLDFPTLYASGRDGWAAKDLHADRSSLQPLMDAILEYVPAPELREGPVQMQVMTLDYSDYVGRIGIGRVYRGCLDLKTPVRNVKQTGMVKPTQVKQLFTFEGLKQQAVESVGCGELCAVVGINDVDIGDTLADAEHPEPLPAIAIDEPTISMVFRINDSPFFGREGKYVTSRHLRERLFRETERDVALRVREMGGDSFEVSGRGVLHLSILVENMRREGFEMTIAQPQVIYKERHGVREEPIEVLTVDVPEAYSGKVIEFVGARRGEMVQMDSYGVRKMLEFHIPTRGTIGLRSRLLTATAGGAIVSHRFVHYGPAGGPLNQNNNGVLVSIDSGKATAFAIDALQLRGTFFIGPGDECYEGMILGEHCIGSDLMVNIQKGKQLTNIRAAGCDRNLKIAPPVRLSLEEALEYIDDDELVEVTPKNIRLRKKLLSEHDRKRQRREANV
jgi:GTP-binding protein